MAELGGSAIIRRLKNLFLLIGMLSVLTGCHSPMPSPPTDPVTARTMLNNCYSLLHQLFDEEKDVSLLRFIKREDDDVKILVNKIAKFSRTGSVLLEEFTKHDPLLFLGDLRLPPGEIGTRNAIATTAQKDLLAKKGDDFRLILLLTQAESMNYGRHLALVASRNEPQAARAKAMLVLSGEMTKLYDDTLGLLQVKGLRQKGK